MAEAAQQQTQTVEDLGKLVKGKYPDAYGALSDIDVGRKVKAKYPQYSQFQDIVPRGPGVGGMKPLKPGEVVPEREAEKKAANLAGYEGMAETAIMGASAYAAPGAVAGGVSALRAGGMAAARKLAIQGARDLATAYIAGEGVSTGLKALHVNPVLANIGGILAGMGAAGTLEEILGKDTLEKLAAKSYEAKFGKLPETPGEKLRARGLAQAEVAKGKAEGMPPKAAKAAKPKPFTGKNVPKYGGEADPGYSRPGKQVGMSGAPEPPSKPVVKEPTPPEPVRPKPSLAARLRKGGASSEGYQGSGYRNPPSSRYAKLKAEDTAGADAAINEEGAPAPAKPKPKLKDKAKATAGTAPAARATEGSPYSFTHPKDSLTDVRKQLFSNTQQLTIPNDQVRVRFTQLHGHGISAGTYEEIQQFNEYIAKNGKLPDVPGVK